jgi:hypothetical protein
MFRINCLTSGNYIKLPPYYWSGNLYYKMPPEIQKEIKTVVYDSAWQYIEFKTEEAAKWFVSHRLVYNPKRKDYKKISLMKEIFDYNEIPGWETVKLEFEIVEI